MDEKTRFQGFLISTRDYPHLPAPVNRTPIRHSGSEDEHCRPSECSRHGILNDVQVESVTENRLHVAIRLGRGRHACRKFRVVVLNCEKRSGFISPSASLEFSVPTSRRRFGYV